MKKHILTTLALTASAAHLCAQSETQSPTPSVEAHVVSPSEIEVRLTDDGTFVAFALDFLLPTGVELSTGNAVTATSRTDADDLWPATSLKGETLRAGHELSTHSTTDSPRSHRIVGYSLSNHPITGESGGAIFTLHVTHDSEISTETLAAGTKIVKASFVTEGNGSEHDIAILPTSVEADSPTTKVDSISTLADTSTTKHLSPDGRKATPGDRFHIVVK